MNLKHLFPLPLTAAIALCFASANSHAQVLLTASEFALLGGTAISVGGPGPNPIVNGHVGLSSAATSNITGFPPAVVSGLTVSGAPAGIISTGGQTNQAGLDLITARNALFALPQIPANDLSNLDLGTLAALAPGVYFSTSASTQTGALILDANFQNGVAWVFNFSLSLTTAANATVTFINLGTNGGTDNGLYWNASTAVNIGDNNTILGNYLAGTSVSFTGITTTLASGGARALAGAAVSFAGPAPLGFNATGGPAGGDFDGGLTYDNNGQLVLLAPSGGSGGSLTIAPGSVLGSNGPIAGNTNNSGTVSPGANAVGRNTVTGNYTQVTTGNLIIQLASATSFDRLAVNGTATLAGNVQVDTLNGYDPLGQSFTFLTSTGGVTGTFATRSGSAFATNRAAIAANLIYAPNSVSIAFSQLPFAGFAGTPNQVAVANAAQASPALTSALNAIPAAGQFPAALNAISPQPYQVWSNFAFASSTALADRVGRTSRSVAGQDDYYFEGGQSRGRARSDLDVASSSYTTSTGLIGGNRPLSGNTSAGAFFSYGKTTADLGSPGSHTTLKDKTIGLRAGYASGPMFAEAILAYGFNRYESTRPVAFPGTAAVASSSTRGHQWTTGFTVGQHLTKGRLTVSPFGGLLHSRWSGNAFTERDAGAFNAAVAGQSATSLRSQLGAEGRLNLGMFQPHVRAAWLHEFSDKSRTLRASLDGVAFGVATRRAPRDTMLYSAGVDLVLGPSALLYTDFSAQSGGSTKVLNEWRVGLSVRY